MQINKKDSMIYVDRIHWRFKTFLPICFLWYAFSVLLSREINPT